ncbi:MAG TPA: CDP-glycerol glycerophosphotransferase family protein [Candidatus Limnocylindrales bacterium]|nr:CDP-glycerol glycerophosphotransferase family protein [Candidatus Limnocylindrales bacterium]
MKDRFRRLLRILVTRVGFAIGRLRSPQPRIVLATTHTATLTGNLRFIDEELRTRRPRLEVVRLTLRHGGGLGSLAPLWSTLLAGYHLAASRVVVVDDFFFPMYVVTPRPGTTRVQVWHAAGAFKKFGYSVLDKAFGADEDLVKTVAIHSNYSLALVSSMSIARHYAEAFGQPGPIFTSRIGIPRTDLFGDPERRGRAEARVRSTYSVPAGKRVILYAPTFRGASVGNARYADLMDLEVMHRVLGEDHVLLLKLHPFVRDALHVPPELAAFAIDASGDPDVNELMLVSDVLVTDYSSVIYEFALLGRPIVFLAPDDGEYLAERGFYFDFLRGAPGPIVQTTDALAALIRADAFDRARVEAFARASFDVPVGGATKRLVDEVLLPALDGTEVTAASLEARLAGSGPVRAGSAGG